MTSPAISRIWARVKKTDDETSCWEWPGAIGSDGYGHVRDNGMVRPVHRVVFEAEHGVVLAKDDHILHECDNTLCCRPSHLSMGTHQDNVSDMVMKGRNRTPRPGNGFTKVNKIEVARAFAQNSNKSAVARMFGITPTRVRQIVQEVGNG